MITIIEGKLGSGKTYFVVRELLYQYYKFDNEKVKWVHKEGVEDVSIYTNIDGFHVANSLDDAIKNAGGLEKFFSENYQKQFTKFRKHIYVIDEAQKEQFFHKKFYNNAVFYVFEYARHFGIEFYLITQDIWKLSPGVMNLSEYHIKVQRRSFLVSKKCFVYLYMSDKDILMKKKVRKDSRVFSAYRSQRVLWQNNVRSFSRRYVFVFGFLLLVIVCAFVYFIKSFNLGSDNKVKDVIVDKRIIEDKKFVGVVGGYVYFNKDGKLIKEKSK